MHVLQIRLLVGSRCAESSGGDKSAGVSAWLQTAAPWGPTDPGAKGRRKTAGCDEHLPALSPLSVSLPRSFALSAAPGELLHAPLSSLCIFTAHVRVFNRSALI